MALKLNRIKINIETASGPHGLDIPFEKGLNIIRAGNSSGKSTCIQAIIYALGIEDMLTAKHQVPLPHVAKQYLENDQKENINVIESDVWLEIENADGEFLTINRPIFSDKDTRLIRACTGRFLSASDECGPFKDYYVRQGGAAKSERGFHKFLADFLNVTPPNVMKFDGSTSPLYLECIFPLFLVEQKRGWSAIQAAMPTHYSIKDVRKKAIEYVLDLDCSEIEAKKDILKKRKDDYVTTWQKTIARLQIIAAQVAGSYPQIPSKPTGDWLDGYETFFVEVNQETVSFQQHRLDLVDNLKQLTEHKIPTAQEDAERLQSLLSDKDVELEELGIAYREIKNEAQTLERDQNSLKKQIYQITKDISNYADLAKLKKMGSAENLHISSNGCPTCGQDIEDVLYAQGGTYNPLSIKESQAFLKGQKATFTAMLIDVEREMSENSRISEGLSKKINSLRNEIRSIKATLISSAKAPSEAAIIQKIELEREIRFLESTHQEGQILLEDMKTLCSLWREIKKEEAALPKGIHSDEDIRKLNKLRKLFVSFAKKFSLKSLTPDDFTISFNSYHPMYDNFDLGFELSASDVVRMIWAYLVGLLEYSETEKSNHFGLLIFDEPQQQKIKDVNFTALLNRLEKTKEAGQQSIVAMSELPQIDNPDNINVIDFKHWVIEKF